MIPLRSFRSGLSLSLSLRIIAQLAFLSSFTLRLSAATTFTASDDDDMRSYVTLPNHRIIKWNITYHDRHAVAPGYWFVAPYWVTVGEPYTNRWMPYQVGPHIFDQDGELVWTGAEFTNNRNAFDLRVIENQPGKPQLSMMVQTGIGLALEDANGTVLNNRYQVTGSIPVNDKHEFYVYAPGRALAIHHRREAVDLWEIGLPGVFRLVKFHGFQDVDITTGRVLFEWDSQGKVPLDESVIAVEAGPADDPADYLHANSVEKTKHGDYLMSCRHSNTIYLISGRDGTIMWRLGGKRNSFKKDFTFSKQHHARIISHSRQHMIMSFLDNASDDDITDEYVSTGLIVDLNLITREATVLNRYDRPDGNFTRKRGNTQLLPNTNVFISWSDDGYISEFAHDGRVLMEARFASDRFSNYRAYKYPWSARPAEPPTLVASVHGTNGSELSTQFHVSWNGATDVEFWRFWAQFNSTSERVMIGTVPKKGFETTFVARGYMDRVVVEAVDAHNKSLGVSSMLRTTPPSYWPEGAELPMADDPAVLLFPPAVRQPRPWESLWIGISATVLGAGTLILLSIALYSVVRRRIAARYSTFPEELVEPLMLQRTGSETP
ncbi:hypothetical protein BO70DRAFT_405066 [Aspergillus heteromorphus CBS 117.55]|uniref:Arylsulfotransferase n=1 Tax=Aspergillus heteromorphus CBS 117.55 TaxID=1448321 RepID=A0A317WAJ2_9EURO|nr:uncharacterized protein BO70DRAFT_405066 [Aspergillus heteromorphus CBS 117.55]PWY82028.1 hypothetical protein BO70DRAFT_405066 [Aspergillus heteromorphus CBS 117.55]